MNRYPFFLCLLLLAACGTREHVNTTKASFSNATTRSTTEQLSTNENEDPDYANYFVVVADTSPDYHFLHKKMLALNKEVALPIDTMGRFYNEKKQLIMLPEDDEDEVFAGSYFPRRYPSESLSLEYLLIYKDEAKEKTIALVTGIYETEKSADSALLVVRKSARKAFKINSRIYIGCMH
jgi:hypothetical protein